MTWNVRVNGGYVGTVQGRDEQDARHAALVRYAIGVADDFEVSPRG